MPYTVRGGMSKNTNIQITDFIKIFKNLENEEVLLFNELFHNTILLFMLILILYIHKAILATSDTNIFLQVFNISKKKFTLS